jgi:organic radical activating enzyme/TusA-related sulfurtransferase
VRLPVVRETALRELTFPRGLLLELQANLKATQSGDLFALHVADEATVQDVDRWSRLTGNSVLEVEPDAQGFRLVLRNGPAEPLEAMRPLGSRVWLYSNFDCNLACDYCCVRSSPKTARDALGLETVVEIVAQLRGVGGVEEIFVTGGEPFLLEDIDAIVQTAASLANTTVLTNGMLFRGKRRAQLDAMPREHVTLQISIDSPTAEIHDKHRGQGSFAKAMEGVTLAKQMGFRVRLAATVSTDAEALAFKNFLDETAIADEDRVIRRVALRGFASEGLALTRRDVLPELTFTARGVYYHPVGATDDDFLVTKSLLPAKTALDALKSMYAEESKFHDNLASIFHCA